MLNRVTDAIALKTDPWRRMETACVAHLAGLLDWRRANQVLFVMPPWHYPESIKDRVISLRDEYEKIFAALIDDLPLRPEVDKRYLRSYGIRVAPDSRDYFLKWLTKGMRCVSRHCRDSDAVQLDVQVLIYPRYDLEGSNV